MLNFCRECFPSFGKHWYFVIFTESVIERHFSRTLWIGHNISLPRLDRGHLWQHVHDSIVCVWADASDASDASEQPLILGHLMLCATLLERVQTEVSFPSCLRCAVDYQQSGKAREKATSAIIGATRLSLFHRELELLRNFVALVGMISELLTGEGGGPISSSSIPAFCRQTIVMHARVEVFLIQ